MLILIFFQFIGADVAVYEQRRILHSTILDKILDKILDTNILGKLFDKSYDPDTTPVTSSNHTNPVEVDVWVEIHSINEGVCLFII